MCIYILYVHGYCTGAKQPDKVWIQLGYYHAVLYKSNGRGVQPLQYTGVQKAVGNQTAAQYNSVGIAHADEVHNQIRQSLRRIVDKLYAKGIALLAQLKNILRMDALFGIHWNMKLSLITVGKQAGAGVKTRSGGYLLDAVHTAAAALDADADAYIRMSDLAGIEVAASYLPTVNDEAGRYSCSDVNVYEVTGDLAETEVALCPCRTLYIVVNAAGNTVYVAQLPGQGDCLRALGIDLQPYPLAGVNTTDQADAYGHGRLVNPADRPDILVHRLLDYLQSCLLVEERRIEFLIPKYIAVAVQLADQQLGAAQINA